MNMFNNMPTLISLRTLYGWLIICETTFNTASQSKSFLAVLSVIVSKLYTNFKLIYLVGVRD